jgi:hypothetical protein
MSGRWRPEICASKPRRQELSPFRQRARSRRSPAIREGQFQRSSTGIAPISRASAEIAIGDHLFDAIEVDRFLQFADPVICRATWIALIEITIPVTLSRIAETSV